MKRLYGWILIFAVTAAELFSLCRFPDTVHAGETEVEASGGEARTTDYYMTAGLEGSMTFSDIGGYNKLTGYETDGLAVTYAYDGEGRRTGKTVNGSEYIYEYEGERLIRERHEGNTTEYLYAYDSNIPQGFVFDNCTYAYTKDSEGHIVGIALEDGTASAQYIFDEDWILQGIVADDGSTGSGIYYAALNNHYLGIGYSYDPETRLYYNGRYFSTKTGTFLGSVCDTADIGERNLQTRASVDYDAEADSWAQELLNSSTYGQGMGKEYAENWFAQLSTVEIVARLLYAENTNTARTDEREAITWLLLYRVSAGQFGSGLRGVATAYEQFSTIYPSNDETDKNGCTYDAMNPSNNSAWKNATYLACLISLTQDADNIYEVIGKPAYYSNQVYFCSYKSVSDNKRLIGSGESLQMLMGDVYKNAKDVSIISLGTYTNSADIYTDYVYSQSYRTRNVFYNLR